MRPSANRVSPAFCFFSALASAGNTGRFWTSVSSAFEGAIRLASSRTIAFAESKTDSMEGADGEGGIDGGEEAVVAGCSTVTATGGKFRRGSKRFFAEDWGKIWGILRIGLVFFVFGTRAVFDNVTRLFPGTGSVGAKLTLNSRARGCVNGITRGSGRKTIKRRCRMATISRESPSRPFSATPMIRYEKGLPISVRYWLGFSQAVREAGVNSRVSWFSPSGVNVLHHHCLLACSCNCVSAHFLHLPT